MTLGKDLSICAFDMATNPTAPEPTDAAPATQDGTSDPAPAELPTASPDAASPTNTPPSADAAAGASPAPGGDAPAKAKGSRVVGALRWLWKANI